MDYDIFKQAIFTNGMAAPYKFCAEIKGILQFRSDTIPELASEIKNERKSGVYECRNHKGEKIIVFEDDLSLRKGLDINELEELAIELSK